jgi:hypothetical protein
MYWATVALSLFVSGSGTPTSFGPAFPARYTGVVGSEVANHAEMPW